MTGTRMGGPKVSVLQGQFSLSLLSVSADNIGLGNPPLHFENIQACHTLDC